MHIQNVLYVRPRVRAHRVIAQTVLRRAAAVHGLVARAGVQIAPAATALVPTLPQLLDKNRRGIGNAESKFSASKMR